MPSLNNILTHVAVKQLKGNPEVEVKDLCIDSREVAMGTVFIALRGSASDGHQFIDKAINTIIMKMIIEDVAAVATPSIITGQNP